MLVSKIYKYFVLKIWKMLKNIKTDVDRQISGQKKKKNSILQNLSNFFIIIIKARNITCPKVI